MTSDSTRQDKLIRGSRRYKCIPASQDTKKLAAGRPVAYRNHNKPDVPNDPTTADPYYRKSDGTSTDMYSYHSDDWVTQLPYTPTERTDGTFTYVSYQPTASTDMSSSPTGSIYMTLSSDFSFPPTTDPCVTVSLTTQVPTDSSAMETTRADQSMTTAFVSRISTKPVSLTNPGYTQPGTGTTDGGHVTDARSVSTHFPVSGDLGTASHTTVEDSVAHRQRTEGSVLYTCAPYESSGHEQRETRPLSKESSESWMTTDSTPVTDHDIMSGKDLNDTRLMTDEFPVTTQTSYLNHTSLHDITEPDSNYSLGTDSSPGYTTGYSSEEHTVVTTGLICPSSTTTTRRPRTTTTKGLPPKNVSTTSITTSKPTPSKPSTSTSISTTHSTTTGSSSTTHSTTTGSSSTTLSTTTGKLEYITG